MKPDEFANEIIKMPEIQEWLNSPPEEDLTKDFMNMLESLSSHFEKKDPKK
jgi:hypothetical protein